MSHKFSIDQLEERIAPAAVDLGSIANGVLSGLDASGAGSGNSLLTGNDPNISGNSVSAGNGNNLSVGSVLSDVHF